jgi:hypothetical protein
VPVIRTTVEQWGVSDVSNFAQPAISHRWGLFVVAATLCIALPALSACTTPKTAQSPTAISNPATAQPAAVAQPALPEDLRLVLRSTADINAAKQSAGAIVVQPLTGDLWQALIVESASSFRFVTASDLDQLKLSQSDALTVGLHNATTSLPALATVTHDLTPHQIGIIQSKDEETSRVLTAKDWAPLARELDGRLLVAVPASDTVLYCEENGTQSVRTFATTVRDTAAKADHAVSPALLRWTPAGWQSVTVP